MRLFLTREDDRDRDPSLRLEGGSAQDDKNIGRLKPRSKYLQWMRFSTAAKHRSAQGCYVSSLIFYSQLPLVCTGGV
jgi:hypothetical protein